MKEVERERSCPNRNSRSMVEKERTKMRERQRRSITSNIFQGLRQHGGYRLSPRSDINEVLRHLAQEAGWIVEPDGTTYRSTTTTSNGTSSCTLCGGERENATPTPSCSNLGGSGGGRSTTASPHNVIAANNLLSAGIPSLLSSSAVATNNDRLLAIYMSGSVRGNTSVSDAVCSAAYGKEQQLYLLHEATVSDKNARAGSPSGCP